MTHSNALGWLAAVLLALVSWLTPVQAATIPAADEKNIQATIKGQLAAFAQDDADKAFSYAAPNIREAIGTAAGFLSMVRSNYPVVYRPASVLFLKPESRPGHVIQRVQMTDAAGTAWMAIYSLQRQPDRRWRITGCQVVESRSRMA